MRSFGLSYEHVSKCGSLVVAWTEEERDKLTEIVSDNRDAGDTEARLLSASELRSHEPALSDAALGAVLCPREAVVEPWLVAHGYAESARLHGADMRLSTEASDARFNTRLGLWEVSLRSSDAAQSGRSPRGALLVPSAGAPAADEATRRTTTSTVQGRVVVNCAGLYGDIVESWLGGETLGGETLGGDDGSCAMGEPTARVGAGAPFRVSPRKGQFVVLRPPADAPPLRHILELVPTPFTKGVIIWQTLYGHVVVGPTAEPQPSRADRSTDEATLRTLLAHAQACVPHLERATVVGSYAGLRPATEHRDYQIRCVPVGAAAARTAADGGVDKGSARAAWITVAGVRSTGLTGAPGIGEYVAELYEASRDGCAPVHASASVPTVDAYGSKVPLGAPPSDGCPIAVTTAAHHPAPLHPSPALPNAPVTTLSELAAEYRARGDGYVTLYGQPRRVTHPIASFGMESDALPCVEAK